MKPSIYSLTRQDMIDWAEENGEKKFRAAQKIMAQLSLFGI